MIRLCMKIVLVACFLCYVRITFCSEAGTLRLLTSSNRQHQDDNFDKLTVHDVSQHRNKRNMAFNPLSILSAMNPVNVLNMTSMGTSLIMNFFQRNPFNKRDLAGLINKETRARRIVVGSDGFTVRLGRKERSVHDEKKALYHYGHHNHDSLYKQNQRVNLKNNRSSGNKTRNPSKTMSDMNPMAMSNNSSRNMSRQEMEYKRYASYIRSNQIRNTSKSRTKREYDENVVMNINVAKMERWGRKSRDTDEVRSQREGDYSRSETEMAGRGKMEGGMEMNEKRRGSGRRKDSGMKSTEEINMDKQRGDKEEVQNRMGGQRKSSNQRKGGQGGGMNFDNSSDVNRKGLNGESEASGNIGGRKQEGRQRNEQKSANKANINSETNTDINKNKVDGKDRDSVSGSGTMNGRGEARAKREIDEVEINRESDFRVREAMNFDRSVSREENRIRRDRGSMNTPKEGMETVGTSDENMNSSNNSNGGRRNNGRRNGGRNPNNGMGRSDNSGGTGGRRKGGSNGNKRGGNEGNGMGVSSLGGMDSGNKNSDGRKSGRGANDGRNSSNEQGDGNRNGGGGSRSNGMNGGRGNGSMNKGIGMVMSFGSGNRGKNPRNAINSRRRYAGYGMGVSLENEGPNFQRFRRDSDDGMRSFGESSGEDEENGSNDADNGKGRSGGMGGGRGNRGSRNRGRGNGRRVNGGKGNGNDESGEGMGMENFGEMAGRLGPGGGGGENISGNEMGNSDGMRGGPGNGGRGNGGRGNGGRGNGGRGNGGRGNGSGDSGEGMGMGNFADMGGARGNRGRGNGGRGNSGSGSSTEAVPGISGEINGPGDVGADIQVAGRNK